ncbi:MAG: ATP-dependent DNA helicase [Lachnospiraceae bacterium]|nr:ATP-dependent DNA helicase [Lachnospiraceae bacterium]
MSEPSARHEEAQIRISVRGLVEFLLRSGDIDNRYHGGAENAMQEGSRIHRMIQRRMGPEYRAEVALAGTFDTPNYALIIEGRADGIIETRDPETGDLAVTIDEIKSTYRSLERMKAPAPEHLAQARCYAYLYGRDAALPEIRVRITYCNIESEELRYFYETEQFCDLEDWFLGLVGEYRKWADHTWEWNRTRTQSIGNLEFPYPYRAGQRELAIQVYQTIYEGKKLFLEAPTGVGKTVSTLFPAIKAMGTGRGEKLFYLTAKTITGTVAEETLSTLRRGGLRFQSISLTAKEKICILEHPNCNPESCPRAKGHFDRINEALFELVTKREELTREVIRETAERYCVCPFELSLDATLFADAVICDYNYLFDPHARLKRFFTDGITGDYLFLVDEAHNLVDRGREMYSAVIIKEVLQHLRRELVKTVLSERGRKATKKQVQGQLTLEMTEALPGASEDGEIRTSESENAGSKTYDIVTLSLEGKSDEELDTLYLKSRSGGRKRGGCILVRGGYAEKMIAQLDRISKVLLGMKRESPEPRVLHSLDDLVGALERFYATVVDYLNEREENREDLKALREELLDVFYEVGHFLETSELLDDHYISYSQLCEDGSFLVKLFCVDPGENLGQCLEKGRASVLFSATLLPIRYYKKLLGGRAEDYEVYAKSVFTPDQRLLVIGKDVTTKYTRRSEEEYRKIARCIGEIVRAKEGNYLAFFPSYAFLNRVVDIYEAEFAAPEQLLLVQGEKMSEEERREFLEYFDKTDRPVVGFGVLGGIFGEGIDLREDKLIGVIVVGTGIPQVCFERELLKDYFDEEEGSGFDYAYRFPGMNKVLQAAGRVIRTSEDRGVIALLDQRFLQTDYKKLFPREWERYEIADSESIRSAAQRFWGTA